MLELSAFRDMTPPVGHRPKQARRCKRCRQHEERCICAEIPEIPTKTRLIVVMHCRELEKPTATAPLALAALTNSELHIHGAKDERVDLSHLNQAPYRTLLLYPGEGAVPLTEALLAQDPRPIQLVVPDGNWRQAARAARLPGLEHVERVFLMSDRPSEWGIRLEPKPFGLSTFEAIARALGMIEGPDIEQELDALFRHAIGETRAARGQPVSAPEPSERLPILYQDESVLVVNKPSGLLVHRDKGRRDPALLQMVRDQVGEWVYPAHRLDRGTSGAVLLARSAGIARVLAEEFEAGAVEKNYIALCRGHDPELRLADGPLPRDLTGDPQPALTHFRFLQSHGRYGLYWVTPRTGRRHQIRMHLKQQSHPIIGDVRYGKGDHNRIFREQYNFHRLALHALSLSFRSPETKEFVRVLAPLPSEFQTLLAELGMESALNEAISSYAGHEGPSR
jgi:RluA family pseudouridine synthase